MINLAGALWSARAALEAAAAQTAVVSRNIANAGSEDASRKLAQITSLDYGASLIGVTRAGSDGLRDRLVGAISGEARDRVHLGLMNDLRATMGGEDYDLSPARRLSALRSALQVAAGNPADALAAGRAVDAAKDVAASVRDGAASLSGIRARADKAITDGVSRLNTLLSRFETVNTTVVSAMRSGRDATDAQDARDKLVGEIAGLIGVRPVMRDNSDMMLQTSSGAILFETRPRAVSVVSGGPLQSGEPGGLVMVDGISVIGPGARMPASGGELAGLAAFRDGVAAEAERGLDEVARGLIDAFKEQDGSASPSKPDIPGLFTANGLSLVPPPGVRVPGLASSLVVNANVDPSRGGNALLLRDGGIGAPGDPAYRANATGSAGFPDRLNALVDTLGTARPFATVAGLSGNGSIEDSARGMVGWLEDARSGSSSSAGFSQALLQRSRDAVSASSGINLDQEMTRLLELERSYGASARLISTVDSMFRDLLAAVR